MLCFPARVKYTTVADYIPSVHMHVLHNVELNDIVRDGRGFSPFHCEKFVHALEERTCPIWSLAADDRLDLIFHHHE